MERFEARLAQRERQQRERVRRRWLAVGSLAGVILALATAVALAAGVGGSSTPASRLSSAGAGRHAAARGTSAAARTARPTGVPGTASVPVLMYHVINRQPAGAPDPGLYVPRDEFAAQMQALKTHGWHAVTLDQLQAYWTRGVPLGPGKPIVLSFDTGYASQYLNALPVLRHLGWVGVENLQIAGLPPSQGGLTQDQIRGLVAAGWELDTQGMSPADLIALGSSDLRYQVTTARQELRRTYHVPANWFCYPSGDYNADVIAAVKAAGFVGSTTVAPGWAQRREDRYRLPRLRVLPGTSPSSLLDQIVAAQTDGPPPPSYGGVAAPVVIPAPRRGAVAVPAGHAGRAVSTARRSTVRRRRARYGQRRARYGQRRAHHTVRRSHVSRRRRPPSGGGEQPSA